MGSVASPKRSVNAKDDPGVRAALKSRRSPEIRNPKPEGRKKAEIRIAESAAIAAERQPIGSSHSRISGFGLLSAFGLRVSPLD